MRETSAAHGDPPELPRPAPNPSDALLMAVVVAWDTDDAQAFEAALTVARGHLGLTEPAQTPAKA